MVTLKAKYNDTSQVRPRSTTSRNRVANSMKEPMSRTNSARRTPLVNKKVVTTMTAIARNTNVQEPSNKEKFLFDVIPHFNEYQSHCVTNDSTIANVDENVIDEADDTHDHNYQKMLLRDHLVQQLITLCDMNIIISETNNLSIVNENEDVLHDADVFNTTKLSRRLSNISDCLLHIMNSAIASLIKPAATSNSNRTENSSIIASTAILELLVAVATKWVMVQQQSASIHNQEYDDDGNSYFSIVELILSHLCQYSKVQDDTIRIVSVRALCYMAKCVGSCIESADEVIEKSLCWLDTIQQALLPRFTDKIIAVRCAVVEACFTVSNIQRNPLSADPDILQAVQWVVQHDPSPNNRKVAILNVPINRTTMEYIIPRIRDTKVTVRIAVITALSKGVNQHFQQHDSYNAVDGRPQFLIPSRHISELIAAGYTDRYVFGWKAQPCSNIVSYKDSIYTLFSSF
jgi:hypothetical protein